MSIARSRRRVDGQRDAPFDGREPHERWASLKSHPKKIGMLQPGKSARRTRSCDRGESHGQTRLAYEKKEDEGASTWAAATLNSRQRDRHHAHHCASKSPLELQRCRVQHTICRGAEVPSSTHLPPLSPVGIHQDAHRLDSRTPLGLEHRAAELPICIPMVCPISQTAGRRQRLTLLAVRPHLGL